MIRTIGFVGVGTMGTPMARNLLRAGYAVRVHDVNADAAAALEADGAERAASPREAAEGRDAVITMLPNGDIVGDALFGADGIAGALAPDTLYIDMSTILPAHTDAFHRRLSEQDVAVVDAPVGRSSQHAVEGRLLIMAGGEAAHVERARPLLERMGDTIFHCGPVGTGQRMKVVNNYMSIALNALTAEALVLAESSGLDREQSRQVMLGTVAGQGHMGTTYPSKVLKGDLTPGFMVDLAHKDLGLALELAAGLNVPTYMGAVARQTYALARQDGRGRQDWTALYETMRGLVTDHAEG
ncbi:3-sulfolactaldehyde reductase [wastewater metagenome]|uniref:3-sulfolactaldehyde reductase n=2 Tax=unclassified sequences TaxID=12908 RepID=A0A5B8RED3_9ZZZZ|nr:MULTISPECIES: sulfolactaldehyde 3-reductase [Arhodomonas]MCS4505361.1 sulfolactaldehyde 3-reductase [Arhodomonas aquaeolei]QEA07230.1 3-sulfolactaldehyde reductase [uncultured organism]